jgi:2-methylcitrate dehydratase PrpD
MNFDRRAVAAPTRELADWIANLRYDALPQRSREIARIAILDTVGAGVYGYCTPWAQMLLAWTRRGAAPGAGEAHVWGEAQPSLRTADAALVNGTAAHAFELDDYHNAKLHPGAVVVPAAIAVAEKLNSTGAALVTAIAAGYEVMIRSSLALNPSATRLRGWHLTGVCGPFGAAAACASLLQLNTEQTAWALGLAGTQGAGLWAFNADGAMSKRLHAGKAAHSGVLAAELAQLGFTGPTQIYEYADGGVLKAFSDASDPAPLTRDLGAVYHLDKTSIKPYACCGSTHSYVDAALALRKKLGAPWDTRRRVRVGTAKVVDVQCGFDYAPGSVLNAQMSLRYIVAVALLEGQALPAQFSDAKIADPAITALAQKIELVPDPELDKLYPQDFPGWVAAEENGGWVRVDIMNPTGSVHAPIDARGITDKFRGINPQLDADAIAAAALAIERHSVREFIGLLGKPESKRAAA